MKILAIETSCDETAVAITNKEEILANEIFSQIKLHKQYGGIVPEIATRSHINELPYLIENAIQKSSIKLKELDAIAVTGGPGLIGSIISGLTYAKTLSTILNKKFIAINHLEGHALITCLTNKSIQPPFLLLLISGGHSQIIIIHKQFKYELLGNTLDDAVGEVFDKVGRQLKLEYPGGPEIEKYAKLGNDTKYIFPKPLIYNKNCNFSFSGLKTAVIRTIKKIDLPIKKQDTYNICASFQKTVADILIKKLLIASDKFTEIYKDKINIVISGGVASNKYIRNKINKHFQHTKFNIDYPPTKLCTDNAVMIAYAAYKRLSEGYESTLKFAPRSRWNINEK